MGGERASRGHLFVNISEHCTAREEAEAWGNFCLSTPSLGSSLSPLLLSSWIFYYLTAFLFLCCFCSFLLFLIYSVVSAKDSVHLSHTKPEEVRRWSETIAIKEHRAQSSWLSSSRAWSSVVIHRFSPSCPYTVILYFGHLVFLYVLLQSDILIFTICIFSTPCFCLVIAPLSWFGIIHGPSWPLHSPCHDLWS